MIYTDGIHIVSDTSEEELHEFARKQSISRCWFHSTSSYPHYDLPKKRRNQPLRGAELVTSRRIVEILNTRGFGIRPRMEKK
jgi:hypothetical protein